MALYTVHLPPGAEATGDAADRIRFVKDGFSLWAFLLPLPWLVVNRLWLALLGWIAAVVALEALTRFAGETTGGIVATVFAVWFALEAREIQRWTLERRGWRTAAVVEGADEDTAERRFFESWLTTDMPREHIEEAPVPPTPPSQATSPVPRPGRSLAPNPSPSGVIGLFPGAGGR